MDLSSPQARVFSGWTGVDKGDTSIDDDTVVINVSGLRFETQLKVLHLFPDTLLGNPQRRNRYYDPERNEYFFDRNRPSFDAILHYYQSGGQLLRPLNVPLPLFTEEIRFYELGDDVINKFRKDEGLLTVESPPSGTGILEKGWLFFEYPESFIAARIWAVASACVTLLFIIVLAIDTLPEFKHYKVVNSSVQGVEEIIEDDTPDQVSRFLIIKMFCLLWFVLELLARFICCPKKKLYFKNLLNLVEMIAIITTLIALPLALSGRIYQSISTLKILAYLRSVSLVRVMRISKATRQTTETFKRTLRASVGDLILVALILFVAALIFATGVYYAEAESEDSHFRSVPDALWWAIVTLTTVGYGDMRPIGALGKLVGSLCAVVGPILTIGMPVGILASRFAYFYRQLMNQENEAKYNTNCKPEVDQHSTEEAKL